MFAYQFLGLQHVAELHGWTKFVSMQNHYNLVYREEEREMIPACKETGVGYFRMKATHELNVVSFRILQSQQAYLRNPLARHP